MLTKKGLPAYVQTYPISARPMEPQWHDDRNVEALWSIIPCEPQCGIKFRNNGRRIPGNHTYNLYFFIIRITIMFIIGDQFSRWRSSVADEENYNLYTIEDILNKIDRKYLEAIAKKLPRPNKHKTIYGDKIQENLNDMVKYLKTERFFRQSFSSLSNDAKSFLFSLYSRGRSISLQPVLEKNEEIYLNNDVKECLDKLMIFGYHQKLIRKFS
jgi:hypothetical protein